jgi:hypothetical protein
MVVGKCVVGNGYDFLRGGVAETGEEGACTAVGDHYFMLRVDLVDVWVELKGIGMRWYVFSAA